MELVNSEGLTEDLMTLAPSIYKVLLHDRTCNETPYLPPTQLKALLTLIKHGTLNMTQLSNYMEIRRQQLTKIMDVLAEKGYVVRQESVENRRLILVTIDEEGRQLIKKLIKSNAEKLANYFHSLNVEDQKAFIRGLQLLKEFCIEYRAHSTFEI